MPKKHTKMDSIDKEWARKYILDPLTAPEPSQETGPGSSHYNHRRASYNQLQAQAAASQQSLHQQQQPPSIESSDDKEIMTSTPLRKTRSGSSNHSKSDSSHQILTPPGSASPTSPLHPSNPYSPRHSSSRGSPSKELLTPPNSPLNSAEQRNVSHNRHRSLSGRFQGDMSHRPLDMLQQDNRAAGRVHRHRKRISDVDIIDSLDTIGGTYHHGGPYDATMLSRNLSWKTSPLAAVHDSNMEAIRATPKEFIIDSLERHMPLQGTATVPPGSFDMRGKKMEYNEGPDLMREPDAPGGPYKRWADIKYHPDDLKGKGEPSYTLEKDLKEKKRQQRGEPMEFEMRTGIGRPGPRMPNTHQRSFSEAAAPVGLSTGNSFGNSDLQRRDSTGKRLSDGLKRRFGSLRRKKAIPTEEVH
ncbi:hypothetical protein PT974_05864 [Cladobotryum mycophilum]|uniref:Protein kinase n=1 Tax=Cladobotryum mycophilum TaxID=491253 RepID=A0ABR0SJY7_9HYPO